MAVKKIHFSSEGLECQTRKKPGNWHKFKEDVEKTIFNILSASVITAIVSTVYLNSSWAGELPSLKPLAESGQRIGFIVTSGILLCLGVWKGRTAIFGLMVLAASGLWRIIGRKVKGHKSDNAWKKANDKTKKAQLPGVPVDLLPAVDMRSVANGQSYARNLPAAFRRVGIDKPLPVRKIQDGPAASCITLDLPDGLRLSKVEGLKDDLQAALGIKSLQIGPGEFAGSVALTIAHQKKAPVVLRQGLEHPNWAKSVSKMELPICLGVDVVGNPIYIDLARAPHMLVAGTTGSGKSWWLNQAILTWAMSKEPGELKFYMIDPKKVEFTIFRELPHTRFVATATEESVGVLNFLCEEMDKRFDMFSQAGVKNLAGWNRKNSQERLPYIIVVIDELADLMAVAKKDIETNIQRLGQKARAAGIHLVVATQRPSVDVLSGVIKANLPWRVCFMLRSSADYTTVFGGETPAATLTGQGDGVVMIDGLPAFQRFQSPAIALTDEEQEKVIEDVANWWKRQKNRQYGEGRGERASVVVKQERHISGGTEDGQDEGETPVIRPFVEPTRPKKSPEPIDLKRFDNKEDDIVFDQRKRIRPRFIGDTSLIEESMISKDQEELDSGLVFSCAEVDYQEETKGKQVDYRFKDSLGESESSHQNRTLEKLKDLIAEMAIEGKEYLPSTRDLREQFGWGYTYIVDGLKQLQDEGWITREGAGRAQKTRIMISKTASMQWKHISDA